MSRITSRGVTLWVLLLAAVLVGWLPPFGTTASAQAEDWQEDFGLENRTLSPTGQARYFVLQPGFQLVLASRDERVTITVLDELREIAGVTTRVVEEREEQNGEIIEISRNFFAIDEQTGDVFYFGEDVDIYQRGRVIAHTGSWLAGVDDNRAGLMMPGAPQVGSRHYQEVAPGIALDRAEVITVSEVCRTPAGEFGDCVVTHETTPLEAGAGMKAYAPEIGLVRDQSLLLESYGYVAPAQ